jgi:hypothetical protein
VPKPFLAKSIDRYGDCARVQIVRIDFNDSERGYSRKLLSDYETLSRGASASAKKEMLRLEREGALA